jgi:PilZ domain
MSEVPAASERRTALRRELSIPVWVEKLPVQPHHPSLVRAQTRDISHQGAFLWVPPLFSLGQQLRLEMDVAPEAEQNLGLKIKCEAEVVRLQPATPLEKTPGMAVRILKFDTPRPLLFPEI